MMLIVVIGGLKVEMVENRLLDQIATEEPSDVVEEYVNVLEKVGDSYRVWESHVHDGK